MVKVTLELSELQIEMFIHCIEGAIDVKHMNEQEAKLATEVKNQLSAHL